MSRAALGWLGIVRLGLVQSSLGAIVVLTTSTLNRIMVVEMGLPALLPGLLLAWHYVVQVLRPRMGHGSDQGRRCVGDGFGGAEERAHGGVVDGRGHHSTFAGRRPRPSRRGLLRA